MCILQEILDSYLYFHILGHLTHFRLLNPFLGHLTYFPYFKVNHFP
jgi:hypothetical protein